LFPGRKNALHFLKYQVGYFQMFDHHVRSDQIEALIAKRQMEPVRLDATRSVPLLA
jgi:hypothetical protein